MFTRLSILFSLYKMIMKDGSAGGFIWITQQGIAIKMDMLSKSGRDKTRITMTLKNLQIGSQDPQLFELPAGYTVMSSFGFGAGKGGGMAACSRERCQASAADCFHKSNAYSITEPLTQDFVRPLPRASDDSHDA